MLSLNEEFNTMHREWLKEKDVLLMKLKSYNTDTNYVHKRIDVILKFSEKLPELFLKATPEEKKLILSTMAENITFTGKTINIELKETFTVLQNVKKTPLFASENSNLRTPKTQVYQQK